MKRSRIDIVSAAIGAPSRAMTSRVIPADAIEDSTRAVGA